MTTRHRSARTTLVLDTSAILAYAAGSMDAHEPVLIAHESSKAVAVPVICLVEAARRDGLAEFDDLLYSDRIHMVMPDRRTDGAMIDGWTALAGGRRDAAAAAVVTFRNSAMLLTEEPELYLIGGWMPDWVIPLGKGW